PVLQPAAPCIEQVDNGKGGEQSQPERLHALVQDPQNSKETANEWSRPAPAIMACCANCLPARIELLSQRILTQIVRVADESSMHLAHGSSPFSNGSNSISMASLKRVNDLATRNSPAPHSSYKSVDVLD